MIVVNQRKIARSNPQPNHESLATSHPETRLLASIFDTLLSSQGSDAHLSQTVWPASGATLQSYVLAVLFPNPLCGVGSGPETPPSWYRAQQSVSISVRTGGSNPRDRPSSRW